MTLSTAKKDAKLNVFVEDGKTEELVYINLINQDVSGTIITDKEIHVSCQAEGAIQAWFGSSNPKPLYNYTEEETDTWHGRALLVLRRNKERQKIRITVQSRDEQITLEV